MIDADRKRALVIELIALAQQIRNAGGPDGDGDAFEEYISCQEELLQTFALPPATEYLEIVDASRVWSYSDTQVETLLNMLSAKSAEHAKKREGKTDLDLLLEAVRRGDDSMNALPIIGVTTHIYPHYLYELIDPDDEEGARKVLSEMKEAELVLNDIGIVAGLGRAKERDRYVFLKQHYVPHLDAFLDHQGA